MKLLICLITYNRLEYTKRTLQSLKDTITLPYELIIVDNKSTDGTRDWLNSKDILLDNVLQLLETENVYPGKACNDGWAELVNYEGTHYMRCDNDMEFEPGWDKQAEAYFKDIPQLGQLGLDHSALDTFNGDARYFTPGRWLTINAWPGNVGGPCIIRREVYDAGARYDEAPWQDLRENPSKMITAQEDVKFSLMMHTYGYIYGHPTQKLASTFATPDTWGQYPDYYKQTMKERGYDHNIGG